MSKEPVSKRFGLLKVKSKIPDFERGKAKKNTDAYALRLEKMHSVQLLEYIEYFADSAITSLRTIFEFNAEISRNGVF